ncbi:MAG: hydantoinase/oxoprolinase family protein, partial [Albidovulum sp.]|nr:hydantoinase/oxoprolinase family protein [Albidovulum sp.]
YDIYNLFLAPNPPLVPRRLRMPILERVRAYGVVHQPLQSEDVRAAHEVFVAENVDTIAIAFLNSFANPSHEIKAMNLLREAGFEGSISLSHQVSGEYREYERTTTTIIDAFVRPRMTRYLGELGSGLKNAGFKGNLLVTRSGGGSFTFGEASERPFETIMSGPVAGAEGTGELARLLSMGNFVAADVGGTSFDTSLIVDGRPRLLYEGSVVGLPVQTPWVDVRSIGAGGGSIAYVDAGGLLRVGPQSAGADPGPAAYGRGGVEPTVTDSAHVLGMLGDGQIAHGIALDRNLSSGSLKAIASNLGFSVEEAARGVLKIVTATMSNLMREITIEQGTDPRELWLLAFGGAGPMLGTLLAKELGTRGVVVPPHAGNFSASGLLGADLVQAAARTRIMRLSDDNLLMANDILDSMFEDLEVRQNAGGAISRSRHVGLDMRYAGQEHSLTVSIECDASGKITWNADEVRHEFTQDYERAFSVTMEEAIEIVSMRATVRSPLPKREREKVRAVSERKHGNVRTWSFESDDWREFQVLDRSAAGAGAVISGPAIILEQTSTTYLDGGHSALVHETGCLVITREESNA